MTAHSKTRVLERLARALALLAGALAVSTLAGYLVGRLGLIVLAPGWQGMSPLTALGVGGLALALWGPAPARAPRLGTWLAMAILAMALCLLASHYWYHMDVVSPWIAQHLLGFSATLSGRVSVSTAIGLAALACASLAARGAPAYVAVGVIEITANVALLLGGIALLGYAYRISDLYDIYLFNTMSLQSALSIACLALGNLVANPDTRLGTALRSPSLAARHMRWMLVFIGMPVVLGWALLHVDGFSGANAASMALLVAATGVPMFYLVLENAHSAELLDRERRAQRDAEHRLRARLQGQLDARTAELAEKHRQDVASLALTERARRYNVIAQLTGSIAHDFNNMLMVIGGSAQLLKMRLRGDTASAPLLDKIGNTVGGAAKLTAQLLAFSRTQRLDTAPVQVDSVAREAVAEIRPLLPPGVALDVDLQAAGGTVSSDGDQLRLALIHLLRNAWEAMPGQGSLRIATAIRPGASGDHVLLTVSDSGCGMNEDLAATAIEPFFTTKQGNHPGLGLAQVNSVVSQASGSMHLVSAIGQGTTVELCMPCSARPVEAAPGSGLPGATRAGMAGNKRLLVIDDDDEVRAVIVALLRQMRYEVAEADSGEGGLRLLDEVAPALAIIDYLMPGMNGAEVARQARLRAPDLPIIFISGYADSRAINAIPRARMLRKPVLAEDLEQTLADALHTA